MNSSASSWSSAWLALRSLLWTILLPGVVAGYVPRRFFGLNQVQLDLTRPSDLVGVVCLALGVVLLGACILSLHGAVRARSPRSIHFGSSNNDARASCQFETATENAV
jgi:hypothetical protein